MSQRIHEKIEIFWFPLYKFYIHTSMHIKGANWIVCVCACFHIFPAENTFRHPNEKTSFIEKLVKNYVLKIGSIRYVYSFFKREMIIISRWCRRRWKKITSSSTNGGTEIEYVTWAEKDISRVEPSTGIVTVFN